MYLASDAHTKTSQLELFRSITIVTANAVKDVCRDLKELAPGY